MTPRALNKIQSFIANEVPLSLLRAQHGLNNSKGKIPIQFNTSLIMNTSTIFMNFLPSPVSQRPAFKKNFLMTFSARNA